MNEFQNICWFLYEEKRLLQNNFQHDNISGQHAGLFYFKKHLIPFINAYKWQIIHFNELLSEQVRGHCLLRVAECDAAS